MPPSHQKIDSLLDRLQLSEERGLYYFHKPNWTNNGFSYRVKKALAAIEPYAFYSINDEPFILFFAADNKRDLQKIHNQAWNFQAPIVIIDNDNQWQIYNGFSLSSNKIFLDKLANEDDIDDFSFWNLHSGKTWEKYSQAFKKKRLDNYLLENISAAIELLRTNGLNRVEANSVIGRLIFTRYLIDRGVELDEEFLEKGNERESFLDLILYPKKLYSFFSYLKNEFHGHLFPVTDDEKAKFDGTHSTILFNLFKGNDLRSGQVSLFDLYDFNIIPIELISNIYERFIGKEERESSQSFYTPSFLVDYILKNTVEGYLKQNSSCKVLDPSCGSGIFLVETLRKIIENNLSKHKTISDQKLKELLTSNIYGVDRDINAINVAIFSLYLTLLDYKHPKEIRNFELPPLRDTNFFELNFFSKELKGKVGNITFDYIIGNPPWKSISDDVEHALFVKDHADLISDYQIAQSFIVNIKNFSSNDTKCALVVTSKILYNLNATNFRKYFVGNYKIFSVLELSSVRELIFKGAIGPSAVIFFQYSKKIDDNLKNVVHHISLKPNRHFELFRSIVVQKFDFKKVLQKYFYEYDWLWKTLVYGNILDFFFIRRIKKDFANINQTISSYNLFARQGLQIGGGDLNDTSHLIGIPFIDTSRKERHLKRFYIDFKNAKPWKHRLVHRPRDKDVFNPPALLIKKGLTSAFELVTAYSDQRSVFTDSITAIRGNDKQKNVLRSMEGCLNSKLFPYFTFMTGTSAGIEREQAHNEDEKFLFPVLINPIISEKAEELEAIIKAYEEADFKDDYLRANISEREKEFNNILFQLYDFSDEEKDLVAYVNDVSIPLFRGIKQPYMPLRDSESVEPYARVFYKYFSKRYNKTGEYFKVDIYFEEFFLAMHFRVVDQKPLQAITNETQGNSKAFFEILSKLFSQPDKITDELFIQKDVKGFEKDSFYVIKPNEAKNWHPAIARLDLMEFVEAILKQNNQPVILQ